MLTREYTAWKTLGAWLDESHIAEKKTSTPKEPVCYTDACQGNDASCPKAVNTAQKSRIG